MSQSPITTSAAATSSVELDDLRLEVAQAALRLSVIPSPDLQRDLPDLVSAKLLGAPRQIEALVLCYKRISKVSELARISHQPAGLVAALRRKGFVFRAHPGNPSTHWFRDGDGDRARTIESYLPVALKPRVLSAYERRLVSKACDALVQAVEAYNRPSSIYGIEAFVLLMINAWELLGKARLIQLAEGDVSAIRTGDRTIPFQQVLNGLKRNRSLEGIIEHNLSALEAIRNDFAHSMVDLNPSLEREIFYFGNAAVHNFATAVRAWFGVDLGNQFRLTGIIMPAGPIVAGRAQLGSAATRRLLADLQHRRAGSPAVAGGYLLAAEWEIRFVAASGTRAHTRIGITSDPDAQLLRLPDDTLAHLYPLRYRADLIPECRARYVDFAEDSKFNGLMRSLRAEGDQTAYLYVRYPDPINKKGIPVTWYSETIWEFFDQHYTRRDTDRGAAQ